MKFAVGEIVKHRLTGDKFMVLNPEPSLNGYIVLRDSVLDTRAMRIFEFESLGESK